MQSPLTEDAPEAVSAGTEAPTPLITGEVQYLWSGVAAVIVIFILAFWLLGRWRARSLAAQSPRNTEFFQPAGEAAEISFDDEQPAAAPFFENDGPPEDLEIAPAPKKKKSPFAGLFAGRGQRAANDAVVEDAQAAAATEDDGFATVEIDRFPRSVFAEAEPEARPAPVADWATIEREQQRREQEEAERAQFAEERRREEERRWRAAEDERQRQLAEDERRRAERDAMARIDDFERSRASAHADNTRAAQEDLARTLSEVEEALHAQREAIQAETRSLLDSFARRFSDRIDALATSVERRAVQRLHDSGAAERGHDGALLDAVAARLDDHRREIGDAMNALARRIDSAGANGETAALRAEIADLRHSLKSAPPPSAPAIQLGDIVRDALAPGAYEFNAMLANNRRADCLIKLARPPGPIAIDARFPIEAFRDLQATRSAAAESEFRRIALRHIVDVAERMISPGFTADSAMLFIPSESMAGELYARFPDVIQDSYRARVWIVSPTTLMATLHALSGVLRGAPLRERSFAPSEEARRALAEIDRLESRIAALEADAAREREMSHDLPEARERKGAPFTPAANAPEAPRRPAVRLASDNSDDGESGHLYEDDAGAAPDAARTGRPPFPLR